MKRHKNQEIRPNTSSSNHPPPPITPVTVQIKAGNPSLRLYIGKTYISQSIGVLMAEAMGGGLTEEDNGGGGEWAGWRKSFPLNVCEGKFGRTTFSRRKITIRYL